MISNELNLVEFEEFTVDRPVKHETYKKNRAFMIDIPDSKPYEKTMKPTSNLVKPTKFMYNSQISPSEVKEPPAPSKGSKKTKVFVFPTKSTEEGIDGSDYKHTEL